MTIIENIKNSQKILIVGHLRPDGDCLGSGLSLKYICEKYNKQVDFLCDSEMPMHYSFMHGFYDVNNQKLNDYDLFITVDCADSFRLGKYQGYLKSCKNSINIDHHKTNNKFAAINFVKANYSSTCEIIFELLKDCNELDNTIAQLLYVGLSTDTGNFMHNNVTANVHRIAANMIELGVDTNYISTMLYKQNTLAKTKLIAEAIHSMRFYAENKICIISISLEMLKNCGCDLSDTEGLIDYGMSIIGVEVTACLTEQNRPQYKVSYRSRSIDVSKAAGVFGGGGHMFASGCAISGHYEDVISKIVKSITDGMA